jgi:hypothetical protein
MQLWPWVVRKLFWLCEVMGVSNMLLTLLFCMISVAAYVGYHQFQEQEIRSEQTTVPPPKLALALDEPLPSRTSHNDVFSHLQRCHQNPALTDVTTALDHYISNRWSKRDLLGFLHVLNLQTKMKLHSFLQTYDALIFIFKSASQQRTQTYFYWWLSLQYPDLKIIIFDARLTPCPMDWSFFCNKRGRLVYSIHQYNEVLNNPVFRYPNIVQRPFEIACQQTSCASISIF